MQLVDSAVELNAKSIDGVIINAKMQNYYQAYNKTNNKHSSKKMSANTTPTLSAVPSQKNKAMLLNAHPYSNYSPLPTDPNVFNTMLAASMEPG